jgi:hypothetical protein
VSFRANAGRILVDKAGVTRFDSDEDLFHIVNAVSGVLNVSSISGSLSAGVNRTDTINIGTCNPACTHVIGAVKISGSGTWGAMFNRWATYAGGDFVYSLAYPNLIASSPGAVAVMNYGLTYRFEAVGGIVRVVRRIILPRLQSTNGHQTPEAKWGAHSLTYKLKCGVWT